MSLGIDGITRLLDYAAEAFCESDSHSSILSIYVVSLFAAPLLLSSYALNGDSIIDTIQRSFPSLVIVRAENKQAFASPGTLVRDSATGAIAAVRPVGIAAYARQGAGVIIDPDGIIRWVSVNDMNVGRNVKEVLRTLDALQTDELCPCNWQKGEATLNP